MIRTTKTTDSSPEDKIKLSSARLNSLEPTPKIRRFPDFATGISGMYAEVSPKLKITFYLRYYFGSKEHRIKLGNYPDVKLAEARMLATDAKRLVSQGIDPIQKKKSEKSAQLEIASIPTLSMVIDEYMRKAGGKLKSARSVGIRFTKIKRENNGLCSKPITDVNQRDIIVFRDKRLELVQGSTVKKELQILSTVLTYAKKEMLLISNNPVMDVSKPKDNPPRYRRISEAEIEQICTACGYERGTAPVTYTQQAAWCFLFAIETGMRAGEITRMEWKDVYDNHVHLPKTKNGASRDVPFTDGAIALIGLVRDLDETNVIPIKSGTLDALYRKSRDKTNIQNLTFHDTRHEATFRLSKRFEFQDLAKVTGHKDLKVLLNVYYNITASELVEKLKTGK
jgi:integrase